MEGYRLTKNWTLLPSRPVISILALNYYFYIFEANPELQNIVKIQVVYCDTSTLREVWNMFNISYRSQIPVTTERFELPISCMKCNYLSYVGQVTALHVRALQFKTSHGHWNLSFLRNLKNSLKSSHSSLKLLNSWIARQTSLWCSGLGNCIACKRFAVQNLSHSFEPQSWKPRIVTGICHS